MGGYAFGDPRSRDGAANGSLRAGLADVVAADDPGSGVA
jgi:hypothetical protein